MYLMRSLLLHHLVMLRSMWHASSLVCPWLPSAMLNTANILCYPLLSCRAAGGMDAERAEHTLIKEEAAAKDRRNFEWMQQLRREGFRKVRVHRQQYHAIYRACHPLYIHVRCTLYARTLR
jgi:hypothetical protein